MKLTEKKEFVKKLNARLSETEILILVDYKGLDVEAMTTLRTELRKEGVRIKVVKNSLLAIASEGTDTALIKASLVGPNAIVTCESDPVAPARILSKFAEQNKKLEIKVGAMKGRVLGLEDILSLAKLPTRELLLGQVLSAMQGVPTALVRVLSAVPGSLLNVLNAIKDQKEAA